MARGQGKKGPWASPAEDGAMADSEASGLMPSRPPHAHGKTRQQKGPGSRAAPRWPGHAGPSSQRGDGGGATGALPAAAVVGGARCQDRGGQQVASRAGRPAPAMANLTASLRTPAVVRDSQRMSRRQFCRSRPATAPSRRRRRPLSRRRPPARGHGSAEAEAPAEALKAGAEVARRRRGRRAGAHWPWRDV